MPEIGPHLRIVIVLLVASAVLAVGSVFVLAHRLETDDLRRQLIHEAEAITGHELAVDGRVDLNLLPQPTLSVAGATLGDLEASGGSLRLTVDRVDLQVKALPLLRGEVQITGVRLVRPVLHVNATQELARLPRLDEDSPLLPLAAFGVHRLSVIDGRALLMHDGQGPDASSPEFDRVNLELVAEDRRGPFMVTGDFHANEQGFRVAARLGRITTDPSTTLQLEVIAEEPSPGAARVSYRGLVLSDGELRLRGRATLAGNDARAGFYAVAAALGHAPPQLPDWLALPYEMGGALTTADGRAEVGELVVTVAGTDAQGRVELVLAPTPVIDMTLAVGRLDVPEPAPADWSAAGLLADTARWLDGKVDLTVGLLGYRDETVRRVRLTLGLSGDEVRIEQARALLPGNADVAFNGGLTGADGEVALHGSLSGVTDDLGALLRWLDLDSQHVTLEHLRTLSLSADLGLTPNVLRLQNAEVRLDASSITGSLALDLEERHRLAALLAIDRLDLDAYWPDETPAGAVAALRHGLARADFAIEADIERLTWQGLRWQDVRLEGRAIDQRLSLGQLSAQGVAETWTELEGEVDFAAERLDLAATVTSPRPALLLRRLGLQPWRALGRIGPLTVSGTARGWRERTELDLTLAADSLETVLAGALAWPESAPASYELQIDARHPDYAELVHALGATWRQDGTGPAPLELAGKLRGQGTEQIAMVGSASLGPTRVTGEVTWRDDAPRARVAARLSLGEPKPSTLMPVLTLAGLRIDPALLAGRMPGNWPRQGIAVPGLADLDGTVEVTGKGGFAGEGLELRAELDEGLLTVERFATDLFGGNMELEASLDLRRRLPFLAVALSLQGIEPQQLSSWLQLPPVLEGKGELYAEATAVGDNAYDLVRTAMGDLRLAVRDGRLLGLPLDNAAEVAGADPGISVEPTGIAIELNAAEPAASELKELEGRFEIRRGIAETIEGSLRLSDRSARIEGVVDLLLWAADLNLIMDAVDGAEPESVKVVGPLDAPQVLRLAGEDEREPPAEP